MEFEVNKRRGFWFYGLAGSGKSFTSQIVAGVVANAFVIDGHDIRKLISYDLGYSIEDRKIQLKRVLGMAQLALDNKCFPIISTVTMTNEIQTRCYTAGIEVILIRRSFETIKKLRNIYQTEKNVVGVDLTLEDIEAPCLFNDGTEQFSQTVIDFIG